MNEGVCKIFRKFHSKEGYIQDIFCFCDRSCCMNEDVCKIFMELHSKEVVFIQELDYFCEISRLQGLQSTRCVIQERIFHLHVSIEDIQLSRI